MCTCETTTTLVLMALCRKLPRVTRKVRPIWILLKQETVGGSGISWAICKCAPRPRQIPTPAPQHSIFLQAGCSSCHPTSSVKTLKAHVKQNGNKTLKQFPDILEMFQSCFGLTIIFISMLKNMQIRKLFQLLMTVTSLLPCQYVKQQVYRLINRYR